MTGSASIGCATQHRTAIADVVAAASLHRARCPHQPLIGARELDVLVV